MFQTKTNRDRFAKWRIDLAIHRALAIACNRGCARQFHELLALVLGRSTLLHRTPIGGSAGWTHAESVLMGLLALAEHRRHWVREPGGWKTSHGSAREQFDSLAQHLLATYAVPAFCSPIWFEASSRRSREHQRLYVHLARGHKIRGFSTPIRLTKCMAQFFPHAPAHLTIEQALRWCQVRGLGGSESLAVAVAATHLGRVFGSEGYWMEVLKMLIDWPELQPNLVAPIGEFLRRHPETDLPKSSAQRGSVTRRRLVAKVKKWMTEERVFGPQPRLSWGPTRIPGFEYVETRKHEWRARSWTIHELTNSDELIEEGRDLRHCVATYAKACAKRNTSIWSLRHHRLERSQRLLTIEVNPTKRMIVQARGKFDSPKFAKTRTILEMWARANGLAIAESV